jgi:two-component system chemotaxis response regulator CheB
MIESDPSLHVVGTAKDGLETLEKVALLHPDVLTLDVAMPRLDGLDTLKRLMRESPLPVIMVSSLTQEGAETTLEALELGAFDYVPKQLSYASLDIVKIRNDLVAKVKAAAETRRPKPPRRVEAPPPGPVISPHREPSPLAPAVVCIGTSTGGPKALQEILPHLPADLPVGVLIVQHMPVGFTGPFARRLDNLCKMSVREAQANEPIEHGVVHIAPAGFHMTVRRSPSSRATICISDSPHNMLHIPSVDVMMLSVAEVYRGLAMGIIMTGMGADGAQGMQAIWREGGFTVGQDESTCAVYGMPRACAEMGILQRVVPLHLLPEQILSATGYHRRRA